MHVPDERAAERDAVLDRLGDDVGWMHGYDARKVVTPQGVGARPACLAWNGHRVRA